MNVLYGIVMLIVGALFVLWGTTRSEFVVYRLLSARSRSLWGENVHRFYVVSGGVLAVLGLLWALGAIWA